MLEVLGGSMLVLACNTSGGGSGSSTGVQECDDYIAKAEACFAKDPGTKAAMEPAFRARVDAWKWKQMAAGDKETVRTGCKAALATVGATMPKCEGK